MYSRVVGTTLCHENNKHVSVLKLRDGKERGKPRSKGHIKNFGIRESKENMCMVSYFFLNWRPQEPRSWRYRMQRDLSGTNNSREAPSKLMAFHSRAHVDGSGGYILGTIAKLMVFSSWDKEVS